MRGTRVPECVGTAMLRRNSQKLEATAHDLPHRDGAKRTVWLAQSHEDSAAEAARSALRQITQNRLAHFVL